MIFLMMLCFFHAAKAEITCRSCQPGNKWRAQELLLKFDTSEAATGLKGEVFGHGHGAGGSGAAGAESRRLRCAAGAPECAPARAERNIAHLHATRGTGGKSELKVFNVEMRSEEKGAGDRIRARRSSDDGKMRPRGSERSQDPAGEGTSSAAARRVARAELRWSGEERRGGGGPRQEELKLNSSTFALTGDSSHNQAMVHWSGQNSSVSDLACNTLKQHII